MTREQDRAEKDTAKAKGKAKRPKIEKETIRDLQAENDQNVKGGGPGSYNGCSL